MSTPTIDRPATPGVPFDVQAVADHYRHVVNKLAATEHVPPAQAARWITEMAKYLAIAADSDRPVAPSRAVDAAWHTFILFTRDYAAFCADSFGRFIHHQPNTSADSDPDAYPRTPALLAARFSPPDAELWPAVGAGGDCQGDGNCKADCSGDCTGGS